MKSLLLSIQRWHLFHHFSFATIPVICVLDLFLTFYHNTFIFLFKITFMGFFHKPSTLSLLEFSLLFLLCFFIISGLTFHFPLSFSNIFHVCLIFLVFFFFRSVIRNLREIGNYWTKPFLGPSTQFLLQCMFILRLLPIFERFSCPILDEHSEEERGVS